MKKLTTIVFHPNPKLTTSIVTTLCKEFFTMTKEEIRKFGTIEKKIDFVASDLAKGHMYEYSLS